MVSLNQEGIINLLKPAGMTSHDGVYFLRKLTGIKRIGHTGTLDPMAVGVLPLCIGNATRIIDYLDSDDKEYRCEMILGVETDTWDIWGNVLNDKRNQIIEIKEKTIEEALQSFQGEIYQLPPLHSAVRIKGKHLYEYARKGEVIDVKPKPVIIKNLKMIDFNQENKRITFDITCSKGTYIRSICHELGTKLECGGTMSFLLRKASGVFQIENTVSMEQLAEDWKKYLLSIDFPLAHLGKLEIPTKRLNWFKNGGYLRLNEVKIISEPLINISKHIKTREGLERAFNVYCQGQFLGVMLYNKEKKQFIADKVFYR